MSVDNVPPTGSRSGISSLVPLTRAATTGSGSGKLPIDGILRRNARSFVPCCSRCRIVLRGQADRRHAARREGRLDAGDLADEHLFERTRGVADRETELVVDLQQRVIEPLQRQVGDAHLDPIGALDAVGVADARNRRAQRRRNGVAVDTDRELRGEAHQVVTSPVAGSVKGSDGTCSSCPGTRRRGSSMPLAIAIGRHSAGSS